MIYLQHIRRAKIFNILLVFILILSHCQKAKIDETTGKKIRIEPNADIRAQKSIEKDGGFILGGNKVVDNFATKNILWRASLETIDFVPLNSANYAGGVIISDWYSKSSSNESIKIEIKFYSKEIAYSSFDVKSYKKICKNNGNNCSLEQGSKQLNDSIKNKILAKARELNIKQAQVK